MKRPAQRVVKELRNAANAAAAQEAAIAAADCLSKARLPGFTSGVHSDIDKEGVTEAEAREIEAELLRLYRREPGSCGISAVIWALSKARNPDLRPVFIAHAEAAMQRLATAYAELSQCVVGLEEFSAPASAKPTAGRPAQMDNARSELMSEVIDQADGYLREAGIYVPVA